MRVYDNGIYRDATAEELAELEAMGQAQPPISPTVTERLSALEAAMLVRSMAPKWITADQAEEIIHM